MRVITCVLVVLSLCAAGCVSKEPFLRATGYDVLRPQFADIPVPEGFKYLRAKSYSFEYDWKNVRHARLIYRGTTPVEEVFDFYREKMIAANWVESGYTVGEKFMVTFGKGSDATKERCVVIVYSLRDKTIVEIMLDPVK